jgi:acetolactate synthase-1/2/3 large subunit
MPNVSEAVVDALQRAGIRYVFGYPGGQNVRFIQAMHGSAVEFVLVTHEASAGFMADVTARLTGRPGACLATLGPGATNMTTGVGNAFLDRVPLTKWTTELEPGHVHETVRRALAIAQAEQPGPVHLDFPEDAAEEDTADSAGDSPGAAPPIAPAPAETLAWAEKAIRAARRPLVAVGLTMNRAGATAALRAFLERHRLPVVSTLMAKGQAPEDGPLFAGVVGRARREIVAEFCRPADLVIGVGYDPVEFNYEDWVGKDVPIVHVDTTPADLAGTHRLACNVVGDIRRSLEHLAAMPPIRHDWDLSALPAHRRRLFEALTPRQPRFAPHHVLLAMRESMAHDALLVSDVGAHTHLIGQLWDTRGPGNFLVSNGWSSMGFCIPAAIAASLVRPGRQVVACTGDGGYLMMVGEINTAVRLNLPVVFVVLRDRYLSLIRVKQTRRRFAWSGVQIYGDGYRPSNTLFGAPVSVVESEEAFRAALARALDAHGPVVIEAVVDPDEYDVIV